MPRNDALDDVGDLAVGGRHDRSPTGVASASTASLSWNVLSQAEVLIAHQTTAELDIKAIDDWIKRTGDQDKRRQV